MSASQPANFNVQEFSDAGLLLVGGRLYTYAYGTTTHKVAYTDAAGTVPQTYTADGLGGLYIALNARGELPTSLYLGVGSYDLALKRADGSTVWTRRADGVDNNANEGFAALAEITGSSLVGFSQAGAGAVTRTVLAKLRETISAADFGVLGDGTDESAKMQLVLNAGAGKTIEFTAGATIRCDSTLTIKGDGTKILGNGATINSYAAMSGINFELVGGTRYPVNINIEDLSLNAYGVGAYGIRIQTSYSTYRRVSVGIPAVNVSGRGFALIGDEANGSGPYYNTLEGCDAQSGSSGLDHIGFSFISVAPTFNRAPNSNTLFGCRAGSCFQNFNIKGDGNVLINPIAESPAGVGTGFMFEATTPTNCVQNFIFGGRIESPLVGMAFSANARDNIVLGMYGTGVTTWKSDLGTGNQVHTAIGAWAMPTGVNFPTLSTDPNALDYYQEGTWTPVPTNVTVNSGTPVWSGAYTRIGNVVTANIKMTGGNVTINAATSRVTLPFAASQVEWGTFGNNVTTALGGGIATYGSDLYFTTAMTASGVGGTISYRV